MRKRLLPWLVALAVAPGAAVAAPADVVRPSAGALADDGTRFDFAAWDRLLRRFVDEQGRVDYARIAADADATRALERLYAQVSRQKLDALGGRAGREAFLIDAYNVLVWKNVLARLPGLRTVDDAKVSFFYTTRFIVAGRELSLSELENDLLRAQLADPRVHAALNCASASCPILPRSAFLPDGLSVQLDREVARFCNEPRNVSYDAATNTARLSHLFDWYAKDFDGKPLAFINRYRAPGARIPDGAKVEFVDWDWRLNDPSLRR